MTKLNKELDELHKKAEQEVEVRGRKMEKGDIFKFVGLIAFFAIMANSSSICSESGVSNEKHL